jgi:hypothetical protein
VKRGEMIRCIKRGIIEEGGRRRRGRRRREAEVEL